MLKNIGNPNVMNLGILLQDPIMVLLDLLGKVENRAVGLMKFSHLLKDDDTVQ